LQTFAFSEPIPVILRRLNGRIDDFATKLAVNVFFAVVILIKIIRFHNN